MHTNSKFALKVRYTLIMDKLRVVFVQAIDNCIVNAFFCINNIALNLKKCTDLPEDDICTTYIYYVREKLLASNIYICS